MLTLLYFFSFNLFCIDYIDIDIILLYNTILDYIALVFQGLSHFRLMDGIIPFHSFFWSQHPPDSCPDVLQAVRVSVKARRLTIRD